MRTPVCTAVSIASLIFASILASVADAAVATADSAQPSTKTPDRLLIHQARLVSSERAKPLDNAWVAVEDGRIVQVGQGGWDTYADWPAHDAEQRYLVPGLIDSHVHLRSIPGLAAPATAPASLRPAIAAYEQQLPRSYLFFGFTTLIDLNVVDRAFLDRFAQAPQRPDVFDCDGALALANGYPMVFAPPPFRFLAYPNFLWDDRQNEAIPERYDAAAHSPEAAVGRVADAGGICVKAFWEDGFGDAKIWPTPTADTIDRVVAESQRRGLTVALHANGLESYRFALARKADVLVHGLWEWGGAVAEKAGTVPAPVADVLTQAAEQGTAMMPTLRVLEGIRDVFDPAFLADPGLRDAVPDALVDWYQSEAGGWYREDMRASWGGGPDRAIRPRVQGAVDRAVQGLTVFAEAGTILFGSDTPSGPTYANPPGLNGLLELRALARAGISPRRLLAAATLDNARAFGLDDRYGTIEPGKVANLLLLEQNPLETVEAFAAIHTVILHGTPIPRDTLSARNATQ